MSKNGKKSKKSFKFHSFNSRGLDTRKINYIIKLFLTDSSNLVIIQECKHQLIRQKFGPLLGPNYLIVAEEFSGLGVCAIYKKNSDFRLEIEPFSTNGMHAQSIKVHNGSESVYNLCNLYCPPSYCFSDFDVDKLVDGDFDCISGDFNADHEAWSEKALKRDREGQWTKIMKKLGLISAFQNVKTVLNNKSEWAGSPDAILLRPNVSYHAFTRPAIADHRCLGLEILNFTKSGIGEESPSSKYSLNYEKMDENELKLYWEKRILESCDGNLAKIQFNHLINIVRELRTELHEPRKNGPKKGKFDDFLENADSIQNFWTDVCGAHSSNMWDIVDSLKQAEAGDSTPKTAKSQYILNKRGKSVPLESLDREVIDHFKKDCKVDRGEMLSGKRLKWVNDKLAEAKPSQVEITKLDVIKALSSLKNSSSPGLDGMKKCLLATKSAIFIEALWIVIKRSFETCKFPNQLKSGLLLFFVKPSKSHKSQLTVKDLRGITLSVIFLKIIDLIKKDKLTTHLEKSNLRSNHVGFRPNRGCTDNFGSMQANARKNMEKKFVTMLLLIDLSSAYNRISHSILLEKLLKAGVSPQLVKFIKFWLADRKVCFKSFVIFLGVSGLPQGSPLSPVLFCFYCDFELADGQKCSVVFYVYADDSSFQIAAKTWREVDAIALKLLNDFSSWSRANGLTLSEQKTEVISFGRKQKSSYKQLAQYEKNVVRYLGLFLDKELSFRHHIEVVLEKKLTGLLYALKYIGNFTRIKFRRELLFSILQNIYWPIFYIAGLSKSQKAALVTWYNKLVKGCVKVGFFVDIETCQKIIGIETFDQLYNRQMVTKLVTVSARSSFYKQNGCENLETDFSEIYTPLKLEKYQIRRELRPNRKEVENSFRLSKTIMQNEVWKIANESIKWDELPWLKNQTFFKERWWGSVKITARESVENLGKKRQEIIKNSLYVQKLSKLKTLKQEKIVVSNFIENRRENWTFVPEELINERFNSL